MSNMHMMVKIEISHKKELAATGGDEKLGINFLWPSVLIKLIISVGCTFIQSHILYACTFHIHTQ